MNPVRLGVVGLGHWGPNLARNVQELECTELVGICDTNQERLEMVARRFAGAEAHGSMESLLEDDEVDAVAIATPVSSHFPLGRAALEAGKHVFVEKPLAASSAECLELIRLAGERNLLLMPGHTFLYSPPVVAIRELIEEGALGDLYFISTSRVNLGLHQPDVSVAWDLGPHDFSILRYWLGEGPTGVSALTRGFVIPSIPDVAFIDLEFPSRTIAHVELSWLAPSKLRRTTIVGSDKMVVYDDTSTEPVRIFDSGVELKDPESFGEFQLSYRAGDIVSPRIDAAEPLSLELRDFCESIRTGVPPRSSAAVGLEVVRMIEAVDRSEELGGSRVALEELDPLVLARGHASAGHRESGDREAPVSVSPAGPGGRGGAL
jgi:predicted dehydrogenase